MPDFSRGDGSGRLARPVQLQAFREINDHWAIPNHAIIAPTGSGKSFISRTIQSVTGADILTISNVLVDQYCNDYPTVNHLKGKTHYDCSSGMSCRDWQDLGMDPCENCPYTRSKLRALEEPTFFNPMSYYYFKLSQQVSGNSTLVIDETHQLPSMVSMLCGKRFKRSEYAFSEKVCNELYFVKWAKDQIQRLDRLSNLYYKRGEFTKLAKCKSEIETISYILNGIEESPQNYVFYISKEARETYLDVRPIFPPASLMYRIVGGKKLILMSGTLFDHDIKAICGEKEVARTEINSPIPAANRKIYWRPAKFKVNYQTDPQQLADYIKVFIERGKNTMIHTSYALSKRLTPYFPTAIINTQEDKDAKVQEFKEKGGVFLASGCAEGIDFKGDYCRINIIPALLWPNLNDPVVQKRKALEDGELWFKLETLKTTIQQAGRSTRSQDDFSKIYVLDPNFKWLVESCRKYLPRYFLDSLEM